MLFKILPFGFILFSINQSLLSQSKKDQIEFLTHKNDSLNSLLIHKTNKIQTLQNTIKTLEAMKLDDSLNCIIQMNQFINQIDNLKETLRRQSDSLDIKRQQIKTLTQVRDLSDGIFTENEYQYLLKNFGQKLLWSFPFYTKTDKNINPNDTENHYFIKLVGESKDSETPYISFSNYNPELAGDLDNDGIYEILFSIDFYDGGGLVNQLYCLKVFPNNVFMLFELKFPDVYGSSFEMEMMKREINCNRHLENSSMKSEKNRIFITISCWDEIGQHEIIDTEYYKFNNTELLIVNLNDE